MCPTRSTATCRTMAPCAGSALRRNRAQTCPDRPHRQADVEAADAVDSAAGGWTLGTRPGRMRIRFHAARSHEHGYYLGLLLCQRSDAIRRENQSRALDQPVAAHARFRAEQSEVPLPLDAAAGGGSVRSQRGLLRLPGYFPHHQRRSELVGDQRRSFDARSEVCGRRRVELSAITWANFTAR